MIAFNPFNDESECQGHALCTCITDPYKSLQQIVIKYSVWYRPINKNMNT